MNNETAKSMINYRFYLEQSRIKKEMETCLRPTNELLKKRKSYDLALKNYYAAYLNCTVQMIRARLQVEKDVRQRIGLGIEEHEAQQLNGFVMSIIEVQEQALINNLKRMKIPVPNSPEITFYNLRSKVSEIVGLFCQEIDFDEVRPIMNVQKPLLKQYNVNQLVFNIEHNINATSDKSLAIILQKLMQVVKNLDLNAEKLTESLELIEGLTEQAKLHPQERKRGIINGCLQRLTTVIKESDNAGLAVQIMQIAATVAIAFDCTIDLTVLL